MIAPLSKFAVRLVWLVRIRLVWCLKFGLLRATVQLDGSAGSGVSRFAAVAMNEVSR